RLGGTVLELDALPGDLVDLQVGRSFGQHSQPDHRPFVAANHVDDVLELHVHDVDHLTVFALTDADDAVVRLEVAHFGRRSAGQHAADDGIAVLLIQLG